MIKGSNRTVISCVTYIVNQYFVKKNKISIISRYPGSVCYFFVCVCSTCLQAHVPPCSPISKNDPCVRIRNLQSFTLLYMDIWIYHLLFTGKKGQSWKRKLKYDDWWNDDYFLGSKKIYTYVTAEVFSPIAYFQGSAS